MIIPPSTVEYDRETVRRVIQRLLAAEWITSSIVTAGAFEVVFSETGIAQMTRLAETIAPAIAPAFGLPNTLSIWRRFVLAIQRGLRLGPAYVELRLKSKAEKQTFFILLILFARDRLLITK